ncbi:MAG TPA: sigma-70 family RNA polymerase sigma factor [Burkholderiaceae bacterium]|nr:sigma-70 family RNA polymerase sigma factor [Burkholderiaceae bacterium]
MNDRGEDRESAIAATVQRERARLVNFIRRSVRDRTDAEDILQDVLHEFVEAYRLPESIEQAGAWLFRVARNRIVDRFRKKKEQPLSELVVDRGEPAIDADDDEIPYRLDLALPSPDAGPEAQYARRRLLDALQQALAALPENQREVFVAHEIEGLSFKELALRTGAPVNTLLARKRYAVQQLRSRLQPIYDEFDF